MADRRATVAAANVAIFFLSLGQVRDDKSVEPLRERVQPTVKLRPHGVRRVRSQRRYDTGVTVPACDELFGLGQGTLEVGGISNVEVGVRQNPAYP